MQKTDDNVKINISQVVKSSNGLIPVDSSNTQINARSLLQSGSVQHNDDKATLNVINTAKGKIAYLLGSKLQNIINNTVDKADFISNIKLSKVTKKSTTSGKIKETNAPYILTLVHKYKTPKGVIRDYKYELMEKSSGNTVILDKKDVETFFANKAWDGKDKSKRLLAGTGALVDGLVEQYYAADNTWHLRVNKNANVVIDDPNATNSSSNSGAVELPTYTMTDVYAVSVSNNEGKHKIEKYGFTLVNDKTNESDTYTRDQLLNIFIDYKDGGDGTFDSTRLTNAYLELVKNDSNEKSWRIRVDEDAVTWHIDEQNSLTSQKIDKIVCTKVYRVQVPTRSGKVKNQYVEFEVMTLSEDDVKDCKDGVCDPDELSKGESILLTGADLVALTEIPYAKEFPFYDSSKLDNLKLKNKKGSTVYDRQAEIEVYKDGRLPASCISKITPEVVDVDYNVWKQSHQEHVAKIEQFIKNQEDRAVNKVITWGDVINQPLSDDEMDIVNNTFADFWTHRFDGMCRVSTLPLDSDKLGDTPISYDIVPVEKGSSTNNQFLVREYRSEGSLKTASVMKFMLEGEEPKDINDALGHHWVRFLSCICNAFNRRLVLVLGKNGTKKYAITCVDEVTQKKVLGNKEIYYIPFTWSENFTVQIKAKSVELAEKIAYAQLNRKLNQPVKSLRTVVKNSLRLDNETLEQMKKENTLKIRPDVQSESAEETSSVDDISCDIFNTDAGVIIEQKNEQVLNTYEVKAEVIMHGCMAIDAKTEEEACSSRIIGVIDGSVPYTGTENYVVNSINILSCDLIDGKDSLDDETVVEETQASDSDLEVWNSLDAVETVKLNVSLNPDTQGSKIDAEVDTSNPAYDEISKATYLNISLSHGLASTNLSQRLSFTDVCNLLGMNIDVEDYNNKVNVANDNISVYLRCADLYNLCNEPVDEMEPYSFDSYFDSMLYMTINGKLQKSNNETNGVHGHVHLSALPACDISIHSDSSLLKYKEIMPQLLIDINKALDIEFIKEMNKYLYNSVLSDYTDILEKYANEDGRRIKQVSNVLTYNNQEVLCFYNDAYVSNQQPILVGLYSLDIEDFKAIHLTSDLDSIKSIDESKNIRIGKESIVNYLVHDVGLSEEESNQIYGALFGETVDSVEPTTTITQTSVGTISRNIMKFDFFEKSRKLAGMPYNVQELYNISNIGTDYDTAYNKFKSYKKKDVNEIVDCLNTRVSVYKDFPEDVSVIGGNEIQMNKIFDLDNSHITLSLRVKQNSVINTLKIIVSDSYGLDIATLSDEINTFVNEVLSILETVKTRIAEGFDLDVESEAEGDKMEESLQQEITKDMFVKDYATFLIAENEKFHVGDDSSDNVPSVKAFADLVLSKTSVRNYDGLAFRREVWTPEMVNTIIENYEELSTVLDETPYIVTKTDDGVAINYYTIAAKDDKNTVNITFKVLFNSLTETLDATVTTNDMRWFKSMDKFVNVWAKFDENVSTIVLDILERANKKKEEEQKYKDSLEIDWDGADELEGIDEDEPDTSTETTTISEAEPEESELEIDGLDSLEDIPQQEMSDDDLLDLFNSLDTVPTTSNSTADSDMDALFASMPDADLNDNIDISDDDTGLDDLPDLTEEVIKSYEVDEPVLESILNELLNVIDDKYVVDSCSVSSNVKFKEINSMGDEVSYQNGNEAIDRIKYLLTVEHPVKLGSVYLRLLDTIANNGVKDTIVKEAQTIQVIQLMYEKYQNDFVDKAYKDDTSIIAMASNELVQSVLKDSGINKEKFSFLSGVKKV